MIFRFAWVMAVLPAAYASAQPTEAPKPVEPTAIEVGQPFPVVMLPRMDTGQPDTIVKYRGQKIIMHIFASW